MTCSVPGYQVERLLGSGSQGAVWLARSEIGGERVALKCIRTPTAATAAAARQEAALLAVLDHPSLIELRDFIPLDGSAVLVLELAEAGTLASLLRRRDRLTPAETVAAISPVAAALAHAHEAGVLHGDVSPANILFTVAGYPKLADLGVARMLAGPDQQLGTPAYLDPAIAAGGAAGQASDVFSLAAVTLHALTGKGPWQRLDAGPSSAEQVLALAATGRVVDLAQRLKSMPPAIAGALGRALAADPVQRGSAAELALDLRAALPPKPIVLAGGRILERAGRHAADRHPVRADRPAAKVSAEPADPPATDAAFWDPSMTGPRFVPAELTRITPSREQGVAESLRSGGRTGDSTDLAEQTPPRWRQRDRLRSIVPTAASTGAGRWFQRAGWQAWRRPRTGSVGAAWTPVIRAGTGRAAADRASGPRNSPLARLSAGRLAGLSGRRRATGLAVGIALLAVGTGTIELRSRDRADASVATPAAVRVQPHGATRTGTGATVGGPVASTVKEPRAGSVAAADSEVVTAQRAMEILTALDAFRERAYSRRDAVLLSRVYAAPGLFAADAAELGRTVPEGCGLIGVRTRYRALRLVSFDGGGDPPRGTGAVGHAIERTDPPANRRSIGGSSAGDLVVEVVAAMPASTLTCGGQVEARINAPSPLRLRLILTSDGSGYRIASQRRA